MKKGNKLQLADLKVESFSTSEKSSTKGGEASFTWRWLGCTCGCECGPILIA